MVWLKRFVLMLQFLTTIPIRAEIRADSRDFGKGLVLAPVVGLLLGGLLCAGYRIFMLVFPVLPSAGLTLVLYIWLTGGLHLDGLADTFDGIFSRRPRERILEIMRDSRIGTNGVLAVACVLLLDATVLAALDTSRIWGILILMPAAGRIGSLIGAGFSTYARQGEGLGKSFIDWCESREVFIGLIPYLIAFWAVFRLTGLAAGVFCAVTAWLLVKFLGRKIGGATGDILGAVCELNQMLFLLLMLGIQRFLP